MKMVAKANFINQRKVESKKSDKVYFFAKFDDGDGEIECQVDMPLSLQRFKLCEIYVDVVQGQFPRYNLVSFKELS